MVLGGHVPACFKENHSCLGFQRKVYPYTKSPKRTIYVYSGLCFGMNPRGTRFVSKNILLLGRAVHSLHVDLRGPKQIYTFEDRWTGAHTPRRLEARFLSVRKLQYIRGMQPWVCHDLQILKVETTDLLGPTKMDIGKITKRKLRTFRRGIENLSW